MEIQSLSVADQIVFVATVLFLAVRWWRLTRLVRSVRPWDTFSRSGRVGSGSSSAYRFSTSASSSPLPGPAFLTAPQAPFPAVGALVSLAVVTLALWMTLSSGDPTVRKAAYGLLGLVVGYWIRAPS